MIKQFLFSMIHSALLIHTYKRLRIVSVPFKTAQDRRAMTQIDAKAVFFHSEFGIKADFPFFSRQLIQAKKAGIIAEAAHSKAMFSGWCMLEGSSVMTLESGLVCSVASAFVRRNLRKDIGNYS